MKQYTYDGPVTEFGRCITNRWKASTYAISENKARSNLAYQFKKQYNRASNSKISLPGKIIVITGKESTYGREQLHTKFS